MGETSDQIERHIRRTRDDLSDNLSELEVSVRSVFDWRTQFAERPGTMLAVAFGGGVLLSALLPRHMRSFVGRWTAPMDGNPSGTKRAWDALKGALMGIATAKLSSFIEDLLPGFNEEFTKAKKSNGHSMRQEYAVGDD
jgi:hypothetical protein